MCLDWRNLLKLTNRLLTLILTDTDLHKLTLFDHLLHAIYWHLLTLWPLIDFTDTDLHSEHLLPFTETYWPLTDFTDTSKHLLTLTDTYLHFQTYNWHLLTLTDTDWHWMSLNDTDWHLFTNHNTKDYIMSLNSMNLRNDLTSYLLLKSQTYKRSNTSSA